MPPTQKNALVGYCIFLFIMRRELQIPFDKWLNNMPPLKFETYLVGKLTNVIWDEDWDVEYFVDNSTKTSFRKLIHDMYDPNIEVRKIVQHIMRTLMVPSI